MREKKKLQILGTVLTLSSMVWSLLLPLNSAYRVQANERVEVIGDTTSKSSVEFEENRGQFDKKVRYRAQAAGTTIYLTADEAVYVLPMAPRSDESGKTDEFNNKNPKSEVQKALALRMKIAGANLNSLHTGEAVREHRTNYFRGSNEANWLTDVPNFGRIRYENVYEGISMIWHGRERGATQYDFIVSPGADPGQINLQFNGADRLETDAEGNLLIFTEAGILTQTKPFSYQDSDGLRSEIESSFTIDGNRVGFAVGEYDRSRTLTIDPSVNLNNLAFSTLLGGSSPDEANGIAVDSAGNTYIAGYTLSSSYPTTAGTFDTTFNDNFDVFVTKVNASGSGLLYSTFIGGSFNDIGYGIAIDAAGNAYITGSTNSPAFPTTAAALDTTINGNLDVFVTKLNAAGSGLVYSTFIGGPSNDTGNGIAVNSAGNAFITGFTLSPGYPTSVGAFDTTYNGLTDAFITALNTAGSGLVHSTFIGGGNTDVGTGIAADAAGNAYITGTTLSPAYPTTAGAFDTSYNALTDAVVTKLDAAGSALVYSTFIGGFGDDEGNGIAVDAAGNAFITGSTNSPDYPTTAGAYDEFPNGSQDVIVTKFNATGSGLIYSTVIGLGGFDAEEGNAIAVDPAGNAHITGSTGSDDYPTTAGAFDTTHNGDQDVFVTKFNPAGSALVYSTFIGGDGTDEGNGIAIDAAGNAYIAGSTLSSGYPVTNEAFQPFNAGLSDAFVSKLGDYVIAGRVIDTTGAPIPNVMVAMSGQISNFMITGADGRFIFLNAVPFQPHTVTATRSGFTINPTLFNIASLNNNRDLIFVGTAGNPTGGSGGVLRVANLSYVKAENGGSVILTIERVGLIFTTDPVTVDYATSDATAVAGQDYVGTNGVLTFNNGESSKTVAIPILNDATLEPLEYFRFALSNPTNYSEIDPNRAAATLQILDEDLAGGSLLISEFRLRGRLGANDEYIKLYNPNDFDVTAFAGDGSNGLTLAKSNGGDVSPVATIPNLVTIPARGHYLLTNNNPNGGFSLIDYPTGRGSTTAVGDLTFSTDIADNANLGLLKTANSKNFNQANLLDAVGFSAGWMGEGTRLAAIGAENAENCYVRKLTPNGFQDTNNNNGDFILLDNHARVYAGSAGNLYSVLGAPAPETTESLRFMDPSAVVFGEYVTALGSEKYDSASVPNGAKGTLTLYRQITNNSNTPLIRLRLRVIDFPTEGSGSQRRYSSRPDFRLLSSVDETIETLQAEYIQIRGLTLAAERLQPNGGGINSTLTVDSITPATPLQPGQSVVIAIRLGVMRYGRHPFSAAIEAME